MTTDRELRPANLGVLRERPPFPPYRGGEPYLFVSYAHADEVPVYKEISRLHRAGVRLWYDNGIPAGSVWRAEIAERIDSPRCTAILFFRSSKSIVSRECYREVSYADARGKTIIVIDLEEIACNGGPPGRRDPRGRDDLSKPFDLLLSVCQAIAKYQLDFADYVELLERDLPREVHGEPPDQRAPSAPDPREAPAASPGEDSERELIVGMYLGVCCPGEVGWQPLAQGAVVPRNARFKLLVQPETECRLLLVIETLDREGATIGVDLLGPGGEARGGALAVPGIWDTLPGGGKVLEEAEPDRVAAWRLGIVVDGTAGPGGLAESMPGGERGPVRIPDAWRAERHMGLRPIRLPLATCKAFDLPDHAPAVSLEGRREIVRWIEVRFR